MRIICKWIKMSLKVKQLKEEKRNPSNVQQALESRISSEE